MPKKIIISGEIGTAVTAAQVRKDINAAGKEDVEIQISSPGGNVAPGLEIYSIIRDRKRDFPASRLTARIIGIAASMGSYIAANEGFDRVYAEDNAVFMLHNPAATLQGDAEELRKTASILDRLTDILARVYSRRMKKSIAEVKAIMQKEEWYTGQDILENGLADEIISTGNAQSRTQALARAKAQYAATLPRIRLGIAAYAGLRLESHLGLLLGTDREGKPVFSSDAKMRPRWFLEMSTLTTDGRTVFEALRGSIDEHLYHEALDNIRSTDGIIRNKSDIEAAAVKFYGPEIRPVPLPLPRSLDGIIRDDADIQAAIAQGAMMNLRGELSICELLRAARQFEKYPEPWQEGDLKRFEYVMKLIRERLAEIPHDKLWTYLMMEITRLERLKAEFEARGKTCM